MIFIWLRGYIKRNLFISKEATIKDLIETIISTTGIVYKDFNFLFNTKELNINDTTKIGGLLMNQSVVNLYKCYQNLFYPLGKVIKGKVKDKNLEINEGRLSSIGALFFELKNYNIYAKKIRIGNLELKPNDEGCFFQYGIKEDFIFTYEKDDNQSEP